MYYIISIIACAIGFFAGAYLAHTKEREKVWKVIMDYEWRMSDIAGAIKSGDYEKAKQILDS